MQLRNAPVARKSFENKFASHRLFQAGEINKVEVQLYDFQPERSPLGNAIENKLFRFEERRRRGHPQSDLSKADTGCRAQFDLANSRNGILVKCDVDPGRYAGADGQFRDGLFRLRMFMR